MPTDLLSPEVRRTKRVFHVTSVHPSTDVRIYHKECLALADAGYRVTLLGPSPSPMAVSPVTFLELPPTSTRWQRMLRSPWRAYRLLRRERPDLVHIHDPELLPIAVLLRLGGTRIVYDAHEDLAGAFRAAYYAQDPMRRMLRPIVSMLEPIAGRLLTAVICAEESYLDTYPSYKTVLVRNFVKCAETDTWKATPYRQRPPVACYVGAISATRGLEEMKQAIEICRRSVPDAELVLAGPTENSGQPLGPGVRYLGFLGREGVADVLSSARIGLSILHDSPNYRYSTPTKLLEYMAAGIPVIASRENRISEHIVDSVGCGILVSAKDVDAIAAAILDILNHPDEAEAMGSRGCDAVKGCYCWETESKRLIELYDNILLVGRAPRRRQAA